MISSGIVSKNNTPVSPSRVPHLSLSIPPLAPSGMSLNQTSVVGGIWSRNPKLWPGGFGLSLNPSLRISVALSVEVRWNNLI